MSAVPASPTTNAVLASSQATAPRYASSPVETSLQLAPPAQRYHKTYGADRRIPRSLNGLIRWSKKLNGTVRLRTMPPSEGKGKPQPIVTWAMD